MSDVIAPRPSETFGDFLRRHRVDAGFTQRTSPSEPPSARAR